MVEKRADSLVGEKIRGYRLEQLLSVGSSTAVYYARTRERWLDPEVLVTTVLVPETFEQAAAFLERWEEIAEHLADLRHPSLFPLYGYGDHYAIPYLLLPVGSGEVLSHLRLTHPRWSAQAALHLIAQLSEALEYLHDEGIVHMGVHPANILLDAQGLQLIGTGLPQLLRMADNGDASTVPFAHLRSITGSFLGNPAYLAPEVVRGETPDGRADVYSLGVLLFDLLSGSPPFTAEGYLETALQHLNSPLPGLHERSPDVPVALELVVNQALHRNPQQRFAQPGKFVQALASVLRMRVHAAPTLAIASAVERIHRLPVPGPMLTLVPRTEPSPLLLKEGNWPGVLLAKTLSTPSTFLPPPSSPDTSLLRQVQGEPEKEQTEVDPRFIAGSDPMTEDLLSRASLDAQATHEQASSEVRSASPLLEETPVSST